MAKRVRSVLAATLALLAAFFSGASRAECGGTIQCIGVGPTREAAAIAQHGLGPDTFTMSFTRQALGTTSDSQTIFVEAVTGPTGTMARLGTIRIDGANASDFLITGGSCSTTNGPVHGGAGCTITVAFRPTSLGNKAAKVHVPLDPPGCADCITERFVTVMGFVGRPDPALDAAVRGVLAAQRGAAQRFSHAQIANARDRMESLHQREGTHADASGGAPLANALASLAITGMVNVAGLAPAVSGGHPSEASSVHFWLGGIASFGMRDSPGGSPALDFRTDGVSTGVDRAFGKGLVAGVALGAARDRTDIGTDGSRSRARGASAMAYASFGPVPGLFIDGLVGGGSLDYRSQRFLGPVGAFAEADRDGRHAFGSIAMGYEWIDGGVLLAPYARADYSRERLDAATETGPAGYALSYQSQSTSSWQGALGLRAESKRETGFGRIVPRARAEFRRAFRSTGDALITYADLAQDPPFALATDEAAKNVLLLGLGADLMLRGGLTVGIDYQVLRESSRDSSQSIRFNVSQALDGRGASGWVSLLPSPPSRKFLVQVDAGFGYDDNVSRARGGADVASDEFFSASVRMSDAFSITRLSRAVLAGTLGGEKFRTYNGLSRATAGIEAELQYRPSASFAGPTLALFARAGTQQYESRLRDSETYALGVSAQSLVTDRIGLFGALSRNRTDARGASFDANVSAARLNVDYRIDAMRSLYLAGEYRRGDAVFSARPPLAFTSKDGPITYPGGGTPDDVFVAPQLASYRVDAGTVATSLGYNLSLGPRESLDFSWYHVRSEPRNASDLPAGIYDGPGKPRYRVNQFLILYLVSF